MDSIFSNLDIDFTIVIFIVAFLLALAVLSKVLKPEKKTTRRQWSRNKKAVPIKGADSRANADAAEQLCRVMEADFKPRPLLNRPEAQVFRALDEAVIARNSGWQVMAQVSLGEFLSSPDRSAYFSVNSKRVDFALMDEKCCVRHALEYQGTGHHQAPPPRVMRSRKRRCGKLGLGITRLWRDTQRRLNCGSWWRNWCPHQTLASHNENGVAVRFL